MSYTYSCVSHEQTFVAYNKLSMVKHMHEDPASY